MRITVVVEPDAANRALSVEMDGADMFRASALTLEGASEKRVHEIAFRDVPAGRYTVLAAVLSAHGVRATARDSVDVISPLVRR